MAAFQALLAPERLRRVLTSSREFELAQSPVPCFVYYTTRIVSAVHPNNQGHGKMRSIRLMLSVAAATMIAAGAAHAAEIEVNTMNMGKQGMFQLEPSFVKVAPGDTVHFVAKDKGHDVETIPGMLPEGAQPFKGEMNKDISVTFTKPGVYGVKCNPHYGMGMVALVVVGDPSSNLEAAKSVKQPGKAKKVFDELFKQVVQ
ncbi:pseudoazurin [Mesorhizobium atlanticum]